MQVLEWCSYLKVDVMHSFYCAEYSNSSKFNVLEKLFLILDPRKSTKECYSSIDESLAPKAAVRMWTKFLCKVQKLRIQSVFETS